MWRRRVEEKAISTGCVDNGDKFGEAGKIGGHTRLQTSCIARRGAMNGQNVAPSEKGAPAAASDGRG